MYFNVNYMLWLLLPQGKDPQYLHDKSWVGLGASLDTVAKEKIPVPAVSLQLVTTVSCPAHVIRKTSVCDTSIFRGSSISC